MFDMHKMFAADTWIGKKLKLWKIMTKQNISDHNLESFRKLFCILKLTVINGADFAPFLDETMSEC